MSLLPIPLPTNPNNFIVRGDIDVFAGLDPANGGGHIFIQEGGLYVSGETELLSKTTITTSLATTEPLTISGDGDVIFDTTIHSVQINATSSSFFAVANDNLGLTASGAAGSVTITSAGNSTDAVLINATDSAGQVHITSAGAGIDANAGVLVDATGQVAITSSSTSTTDPGVNITTSDAAGGIINIATSGTGSALTLSSASTSATVPAISISTPLASATGGIISIDAAGPTSQLNLTGANTVSVSAAAAGDALSLAATGTAGNVTVDATGSVIVSSTNSSTTVDAVTIQGTDTAGGTVAILAAGGSSGREAILLSATSASGAAGHITIETNCSDVNTNAIVISANNATSGTVLIEGKGADAILNSVDIKASLANVNTRISLSSAGTGANAIQLQALAGGINITSGTPGIKMDSTGGAIVIGSTSPGSNVTLGFLNTVTTIAGDLVVQGTTTTINSETLVVQDNIIIVNAGHGELGLDAGLIVRRFQDPVDDGSGNVIEVAPIFPVQETGACTAASGGAGAEQTITLDTYASTVDDFYNGWWITVTDLTPAGTQSRRIKDYVGSTRVATIYDARDFALAPPNNIPDG